MGQALFTGMLKLLGLMVLAAAAYVFLANISIRAAARSKSRAALVATVMVFASPIIAGISFSAYHFVERRSALAHEPSHERGSWQDCTDDSLDLKPYEGPASMSVLLVHANKKDKFDRVIDTSDDDMRSITTPENLAILFKSTPIASIYYVESPKECGSFASIVSCWLKSDSMMRIDRDGNKSPAGSPDATPADYSFMVVVKGSGDRRWTRGAWLNSTARPSIWYSTEIEYETNRLRKPMSVCRPATHALATLALKAQRSPDKGTMTPNRVMH